MAGVAAVQSVVLLLISAMLTNKVSTKIIDDRFLSDVNLEHYYVIEENALSNANVLLRDDYFGADEEELEEDHEKHTPNLTSFISVINEAKAVHRLAGPHLESFLAHPVNVYHLFRRLDSGWREGLQLLLQSKPCRKWNLPMIVGRIRYLIDNLPGREESGRVVDYIAKLQNIYGIPVKDIVRGRIGGVQALKPLTVEEQFEIVKVLHDKDDMRTALVWLQQIYEHMSGLTLEQKSSLDFKQTDILNLMSSAYYAIKHVSKALETTEQVLALDPNNGIAASNLIFFKNKLAIEKEKNETGLNNAELNTVSVRKQLPKYERLCGRKRQKATRKRCRLVRIGLIFYKVEPLHYKPPIVIFHDIIRSKTADVLKSYAHDTQTEQAWISEETFSPPELGVVLNLQEMTTSSMKNETISLKKHLLSLSSLAEGEPEAWDQIQVINVGLEGMHLREHRRNLRLNPPEKQGKYRKEAGAYYIFLNDVKIGGEAVFVDENIVVHPEKGSVLFYYHSKTSLHSFCPVIGSSLWVAVQPVRYKLRNYCVDDDEWL
ncbi:unnamed protein product [Candidula unifasciata]|uniref:Prolyl 4-hydroxylase alpha subunit domain-containing protein n=1 Tax=Candidula unifasciata TaxID=100452 RepID=A0A8S3ZU62_9EUPU|nr:unnamed protein product [Candidula unifasciata]